MLRMRVRRGVWGGGGQPTLKIEYQTFLAFTSKTFLRFSEPLGLYILYAQIEKHIFM